MFGVNSVEVAVDVDGGAAEAAVTGRGRVEERSQAWGQGEVATTLGVGGVGVCGRGFGNTHGEFLTWIERVW